MKIVSKRSGVLPNIFILSKILTYFDIKADYCQHCQKIVPVYSRQQIKAQHDLFCLLCRNRTIRWEMSAPLRIAGDYDPTIVQKQLFLVRIKCRVCQSNDYFHKFTIFEDDRQKCRQCIKNLQVISCQKCFLSQGVDIRKKKKCITFNCEIRCQFCSKVLYLNNKIFRVRTDDSIQFYCSNGGKCYYYYYGFKYLLYFICCLITLTLCGLIIYGLTQIPDYKENEHSHEHSHNGNQRSNHHHL